LNIKPIFWLITFPMMTLWCALVITLVALVWPYQSAMFNAMSNCMPGLYLQEMIGVPPLASLFPLCGFGIFAQSGKRYFAALVCFSICQIAFQCASLTLRRQSVFRLSVAAIIKLRDRFDDLAFRTSLQTFQDQATLFLSAKFWRSTLHKIAPLTCNMLPNYITTWENAK